MKLSVGYLSVLFVLLQFFSTSDALFQSLVSSFYPSERKEVCVQAPQRGRCSKLLRRYYFDPLTHECRTFRYGGCGGNDNNFQRLEDCISTCQCTEPLDRGRSISLQGVCTPSVRYYYDARFPFSPCNPFLYFGCGGNGNNFERRSLCLETCRYQDVIKQATKTRNLILFSTSANGTKPAPGAGDDDTPVAGRRRESGLTAQEEQKGQEQFAEASVIAAEESDAAP